MAVDVICDLACSDSEFRGWVRASNPLLQLRWRVALERLILSIIDISQVGMLGWLKVSSTEKTAAQNGVHRKPACRVN